MDDTQRLLAALSIAQDALMSCQTYPEMPPAVIEEVDAAYETVTEALKLGETAIDQAMREGKGDGNG